MTSNEIPLEHQSQEVPSETTEFRQNLSERPTIRSTIGLYLLAITPAIVIMISGARQPWTLAVTATLLATCMFLLPPRRSVPFMIWVPFTLALILSLSFALPIGTLPEWRATLLNDFQIDAGSRHSPHPWISFERWLLILLGFLWLWFAIARSFKDEERRLILRTLTISLTLVIGVAIWSKIGKTEAPSLWHLDNQTPFLYGPFPNRNHFAGMCAITGLLSFVCAYDAMRRQSYLWIGFAACSVISFAAMMLNTSRFGVLMFFLGCAMWMLTATLRQQSTSKLAIFSSLFLFGTTFLFIFGQHVLKRFVAEGNVATTLVSDGRVSIYNRTLDALQQTPWNGWGIGTFNQIFALFDTKANTYTRVTHPESELLSLAFEIGIPATLLMLVGVIFLVQGFGPWRARKDRNPRRDRRLRNAAAIGALLIAAQAIVDVPLHMIGIGVLTGLLAGLGFNGQNQKDFEQQVSSNKYHPRYWWHYVAAVICIACAFLWFTVHRGNPIIPMDTHARKLMLKSKALADQGYQVEALNILNQVAEIRPIHWDNYFQRATLKLALGYPHQQALSDFSRARALEKNVFSVPYAEAQIWTNHHPPFAIAAYAEAIRREPSRAIEFFHYTMGIVHRNPELRSSGRALARTNPKLHLTYILMSDADEFKRELEILLQKQPQLETYNKAEKLALFRAWYDKADRKKLLAALKDKQKWMEDGWQVVANDHAQNGDFKSACKIGFERAPTPISTPPPPTADVDQLTRLFLLSPTDIPRGLQLYEALKFREQNEDALKLLNELSQLPSFPNKVLYEKAYILHRQKEYAKSWELLQQYMASLES